TDLRVSHNFGTSFPKKSECLYTPHYPDGIWGNSIMTTDVAYTPEESRLASYLNLLAAILLASGFIIFLAPSVFRDAPFFSAPPLFVTNTVAGLWLLAFLAWNSAADVRRFRPMIGVLICGFLIGA